MRASFRVGCPGTTHATQSDKRADPPSWVRLVGYVFRVRIVELESAGPEVDELYTEILAPSFPVDEISPLEDFRRLPGSGYGSVIVALDDDDTVLGGAVGEWDADPGVWLLAWLAVREGHRGGGIGGPLLDAALGEWRVRNGPCLVLAEVEDPAKHIGNVAHGDPKARLRFYLRRGARILDLPYFQAALGPEKSRVRDLHLIVLHADPKFAGAEPNTLDPAPLRSYIELYQRQCEGAVATDEEATTLWQALDRPGGIPLKLG